MATVVNLARDTRFEGIGKSFGSSFSEGFVKEVERERTKQENKQKKREMEALLNQLNVNKITEPEDIFQAAAQSKSFEDPEKVMEFVKFYVESIQGAGKKISMQEVTIDGKNKLLPMTNTDLLDARNRGLAEVLGLPAGMQADFGSSDPEDSVIVLSLETGKEVRRLKKDGFDASKLGPNEATADDFERKLKLAGEERNKSSEIRAKKKEMRDDEKHTTEQADSNVEIKSDLQRRAQGQLLRRKEEVTKESLSKETSIVASVDKFSNRIAQSTGVKLNADGVIQSFATQGDDLRFDSAITTFPDLIRAGIGDTKAFTAAKKIANALEVGDEGKARVPMKLSKPKEILSDKFINKLTSSDVGKVFKVKDPRGNISFLVYTDKEGDPYHEIIP